MSREILASAVLAPSQYPLLALHRQVPERSLPDLLAASERVGDPVRAALFHLQVCPSCHGHYPCDRGAQLIAGCAGWRERR